MTGHLEPRTAVVTGAGSGIGRGAAARLARDGWAIAALDVNGEAASRTARDLVQGGGRAVALCVDVADEGQVRAAFGDVAASLGPVRALVNSAGILDITPVVDLSGDVWRRVIDVNLSGSFFCSREAARLMIDGGEGGKIVNIASVHAISPGVGMAAYDASKGGLLMLTRTLALELAPYGINVNSIAPGVIVTGLGGGQDPEYLARLVQNLPSRRAGIPEDVAGAVAFLCGDESDYVTGSMLAVDGGMLLTMQT